MGKVKEFFGVEPTLENEKDQVYSPSKSALKMAVKTKTDYTADTYKNAHTDTNNKILILGTEVSHLEMQNGKKFLTGNHPVELFVPMLHWQKAGFDFEFVSVNGNQIALEEWALPTDDQAVMQIYKQYKHKIENPHRISDLVNELNNNSNYVAVFIPGGHGVIGDLPHSQDVKKVLQWVVRENKPLATICHGPAALLAANINETANNFLFKGYKIAAFPDSNDKLMPTLGYLPGQLPWFFGSKLNKLGTTIINKIGNGNVHQDRKLVSGDSPMAANKLGQITTKLFLNEVKNKTVQNPVI